MNAMGRHVYAVAHLHIYCYSHSKQAIEYPVTLVTALDGSEKCKGGATGGAAAA